MKAKHTESLSSESILIAEFNYAMQTASQSNEDRVKIFQFVVANTLTVAATVVFSSVTQGTQNFLIGFVFMFFVVLGLLSLFQLSRLRLAWIESVKAMNRIKDYYIENNKDLESAFVWRTSTIPKADKELSLAYLLALTLIFVNAVSVSLAFQLFFGSTLVALTFGVVSFVLQLGGWNRILKK